MILDYPDDKILRRLRKRVELSGQINDNPETSRKRLDTYKKASLLVMNSLWVNGSTRIQNAFLWARTEQIAKFNANDSLEEVYTSLKPEVEYLIYQAEATSQEQGAFRD